MLKYTAICLGISNPISGKKRVVGQRDTPLRSPNEFDFKVIGRTVEERAYYERLKSERHTEDPIQVIGLEEATGSLVEVWNTEETVRKRLESSDKTFRQVDHPNSEVNSEDVEGHADHVGGRNLQRSDEQRIEAEVTVEATADNLQNSDNDVKNRKLNIQDGIMRYSADNADRYDQFSPIGQPPSIETEDPSHEAAKLRLVEAKTAQNSKDEHGKQNRLSTDDKKNPPANKRRTQLTKELPVSVMKLSNGITIYHPDLLKNDKCSPLHPMHCADFLKGNPWTYEDYLNTTVWGHLQPNTTVVHRRLSQGCIPGIYGVLLKFPVNDPNTTYSIYWGAGPLMIPFPLPGGGNAADASSFANLPGKEMVAGGAEGTKASGGTTASTTTTGLGITPRYQACHPEIDLIVKEYDPNPPEAILSHLPKFNIGPLYKCTIEIAVQQCCWIECGYFILDKTSVGPNGPLCVFALERKDLPELPLDQTAAMYDDPSLAPVRHYQIWRVQRKEVAQIEQKIAEEAARPSSMLAFGGITEDADQIIDIEKDFKRHRLFSGLTKSYVPCAFCHTTGTYDPVTKTMSVPVIWDATIIEPLLTFSGLETFDHWLYQGSKAGGHLWEYSELPMLSPGEVANLTNKEQVLSTVIRFNEPQRVGLRLYIQAENYFMESKFSEDEREWPVYPFFDVAQAFEKNFNCYPGRSQSQIDQIPWDKSELSHSRRNFDVFLRVSGSLMVLMLLYLT